MLFHSVGFYLSDHSPKPDFLSQKPVKAAFSAIPKPRRILIGLMDPEQDKTQILQVSFNQDFTCFAVGTTRGFKVYRTRPLGLIFERGTL